MSRRLWKDGFSAVAGNAGRPGRSVVSKVAAILMTFSEGRTHTLTEISRLSELPLSTAHRLTIEMLSWRLLARDPDGGYTIAMPLRLMDIAKRSPDLRDVAGATMDDLSRATGASTRVGLLGNRNVVYIEKFGVDGPVSDFSPAATLPAHATAIGKILLAFAPAATLDAVLANALPRYTPRTCVVPTELRHELRAVRTHRVAQSHGELEPGWSALAAPVTGSDGVVIAALELRRRSGSAGIAQLKPALVVAARSLSRELRHAGLTTAALPERRHMALVAGDGSTRAGTGGSWSRA